MPTTRRVLYDAATGATIPIAGIRAAQKLARTAATGAMSTAGGYGSEASDVGATLVPELTREATHAQGFSPADLNAMFLSSAGAAEGGRGTVSGEATRMAARTHNTGALSGVLDEAARGAGRTTATAGLNTQIQNAMLKERQRQAGLSGLAGVRGGDIRAQLEAEGLVPQDINAWSNAGKTGWLQNTLGVIDTLSGAAGGAAGLKKAWG